MSTFLATHAARLPAHKLAQLRTLVAGTRYGISRGSPERNQAAVALTFDGPREQADPAIIDAFRRIVA